MLEEFYDGYTSLVFYHVAFTLVLCVVLVKPVDSAYDFAAYRMIHYDLNGVPYGSALSSVSYDLRTLRSPSVQVKCVLSTTRELAKSNFKTLRDVGAGCLVILLPSTWPNLTLNDREVIREVEEELFIDRWPIPVYFVIEDGSWKHIYEHVDSLSVGAHTASGFDSLKSQIFGEGYHIVTSHKGEKPLQSFGIANVRGKLRGLGAEESLPSIVIMAHYDAGGAAPALSFGYDSNGAGVVALIELARMLSRLYATSKTHPRYNVHFVLTGAGKYNYLGTRYWLDSMPESLRSSAGSDSRILFTLCLDTITSIYDSGSAKTLYAHVSKPPKSGSALDAFLSTLNATNSVELVHKKINLAAPRLSWEHEQVSKKRIPAVTLSALSNPNARIRESIADLPPSDDVSNDNLCQRIGEIGEALARSLYDFQGDSVEQGDGRSALVSPSCEHVQSLRSWVASFKRSAPLIPAVPAQTSSASSAHQQRNRNQQAASTSPFLAGLQSYLQNWLQDVQTTSHHADKKEPEFVFYENLETRISAFMVKPAIHDLIVALGVSAYLGILYLAVWNYGRVYSLLVRAVFALKSTTTVSTKAGRRALGSNSSASSAYLADRVPIHLKAQ